MNQEQIPQGFDPEVWAKLSPEQKQAYLNGANQQSNQPGQNQQMQAQQMQQQMMADVKKQAFMGMAFGLISSLFSSLLHMFLRRR
ncbi:MAG: hypothetical protein JJT78_00170 [Leptospira sp.]|nr:hypothetical protein [Leptospira sp.]